MTFIAQSVLTVQVYTDSYKVIEYLAVFVKKGFKRFFDAGSARCSKW